MTIFLPYYVAALALLYLELRGSAIVPSLAPARRSSARWIAVLIAAYALQLGVVWYAAASVAALEPWRRALPIGVAEHGMRHPDLVEAAMLLLAALQAYALAGLYRSRPRFAAIAAGFSAMIVLSLAAPAFVSPDPYAYVGDALLGRRAYDPPNAIFPGEFAAIDRLFAPPLLPAPYGPLWIAFARMAAWPFGSLLGKLLAFRFAGAVAYAAFVAALRAYGVPARVLAVAAINPAIAQQYVADAHNDLAGIALLVAAAAFARARNGGLASAFAACAGAIKLPFSFLGAPAFSSIAPRSAAYAWWIVAMAAAGALSWIGAGAPYFRGLTVHVPAAGAAYALNAAVTVVSVAVLAASIGYRRRLAAAVWIVPMASSYVATWYLLYALPYALSRRRVLAYLLVALPLAAALVDAKFMRPWTSLAILPLVLAGSLWSASRARRAAA